MTPETPSDPEVRTVALKRGPAAYTDEGEGPTIVLIHGLPGSVRDFRWLAPALSGFRVIRIDLPGFGDTPLSTMPWPSPDTKANFLHQVCHALGLGSYLLLGHSAGSTVVTSLAVQDPGSVRGLVLLNPIGTRPHKPLREMGSPTLISLGLRIPGIRGPLVSRLSASFQKAGFRGHDDTAVAQTLHSLAALSFRGYAATLKRVRVPTAVIWSEDDPVVEPVISEGIYWKAPHGPRIVFGTGGHNLQKSRAIEVAKALTAWLPLTGGGETL